jgi:hypothetical protein
MTRRTRNLLEEPTYQMNFFNTTSKEIKRATTIRHSGDRDYQPHFQHVLPRSKLEAKHKTSHLWNDVQASSSHEALNYIWAKKTPRKLMKPFQHNYFRYKLQPSHTPKKDLQDAARFKTPLVPKVSIHKQR